MPPAARGSSARTADERSAAQHEPPRSRGHTHADEEGALQRSRCSRLRDVTRAVEAAGAGLCGGRAMDACREVAITLERVPCFMSRCMVIELVVPRS
jgi:hypothetical protein